MKILFTGASSFTGMWFAKELANAGHHVVATLLHPRENYQGLRDERISLLEESCEVVDAALFGSEKFIDTVLGQEKWDLLCHHAADVTDYKSPDFDYIQALSRNTFNIKEVLEALLSRGCQRVVLTGTVFEQGEGEGTDHLRAVSPYGLSKGLTSDVFMYHTDLLKMKLGKFVIPNPFGPYEDERFTFFLMKTWFSNKSAPVAFPEYIRDNIHVSLLAKCYRHFVEGLSMEPGYQKINPSEYVETQGQFTTRFAVEMRKRLKLSCDYVLHEQVEFMEPRVRYNMDKLNPEDLGWNETKAWDALALYYQERFAQV